MDVKQVFRKVLDKYDGKLKKDLEALWKMAENQGTLENSLYQLLQNNSKVEGLTIAEVAGRWEDFADSDDGDSIKAFFDQTDQNEDFISGIREEVESLPEEVKASLADENISEKGDSDKMTEEERRKLMLKKTFPSMDPETQEEDQRTKGEKFRAGTDERRAREKADTQKRRDYELEQQLIREQGPLNRTGLSKDYLEKWKAENPEFMKGQQEKWDAEDARNEVVQKEIQGRTLWD